MRHFVRKSAEYVAKNKALEQCCEMAKKYNQIILDTDEAKNAFIQNLRSNVEKINKENARCKDVELTEWPTNRRLQTFVSKHVNTTINIGGVIILDIYSVDEAQWEDL